MSLESAVKVLQRATELDTKQNFPEALVCYQEGLSLLLDSLRATTDVADRQRIREKIESYMVRAETLKKVVQDQKGEANYYKKIEIKDGDKGFSYKNLFGPYLIDRVNEVEVRDPYIRNYHQIYNFLRLCELLVNKETVRKILLITGKDESLENQQQQCSRLEELRKSLKKHNIELHVEFSTTLHDREIRFDNGWIIKIGRGLDYFKRPQAKFSIGVGDLDLRECHETTVDVYLKRK